MLDLTNLISDISDAGADEVGDLVQGIERRLLDVGLELNFDDEQEKIDSLPAKDASHVVVLGHFKAIDDAFGDLQVTFEAFRTKVAPTGANARVPTNEEHGPLVTAAEDLYAACHTAKDPLVAHFSS